MKTQQIKVTLKVKGSNQAFRLFQVFSRNILYELKYFTPISEIFLDVSDNS